MSDKMREEFEEAYKAACLERSIPRFDPAVFVKDHCDDYLNSLVQSAWWAWKTSRASMAAPEFAIYSFEGMKYYDAGSVDETLESLGLKK